MMTKLDELFSEVEEALDGALLIAWDGCHKMYVALDHEQAQWFRDNYPHTHEASPSDMLSTLRSWWDNSCPLKFISAVETTLDPNDGFTHLIGQDEWCEDTDDDDMDDDYE